MASAILLKEAMPALQIQLLGDFQIVHNSEPLPAVNQVRLQSLLAYLILHRDAPQPRQRLAFLFWPDSSEAQARANLRQTLHLLRQALPDADSFLQIGTQTVQWLPAASYQLDVADFEEQMAQAARAEAHGDEAEAQAALEAAVAHYQGDLLPGLYAEWAQAQRERLRASFIEALSQLVWLLERQRAYVGAIRHANRLLRYEPLHEETYRRLMRLHALNGDRAAALHLYQTCVAVLKRELDVTPNEQTQDAYHSLLAHKTPAVLRPTAETEVALFIPLVGRQAEWRQLLSAWRAAADQTHFVVIAGEAGIGKSRLAEELYHWVSKQGMAVAHSRAYAAEGALAYAPVIEWLRSASLREGWQRLDTVWLSELARLLRELLEEQPNLPHPEPLTESWQRQRLFEALARALQAVPAPLLLVLDDLQWCDQETLAWLGYLLRAGLHTHLLIVGTVRPEEVGNEHPLTALLLDLRSAGQVTEIKLGPLNLDETAALAAQTTGQTLAPAAAQRLFQETEGNPLFVVETVRTEGDWKDPPSSPLSPHSPTPLPPKVHAVIQRRLAQLSPAAQELAGLAAVVGRSFTVPVLAQASGLAEHALLAGLDELWQRRIVREQGSAVYDFSHDRIREVTYAALGPIQRRRWHGRLAVALETHHGSDLDEISGQIAVHCDQAGLPEKAIQYYQRAAEVARGIVAYDETTAHLKRALALLDALPETAERLQQALAMLITLGSVVSATQGHAALEAGQIYTRAFELCRRVGDQFQTFVARQELRVFYGYCGAWTKSRRLAEENLALAQELENPALLQYAHLGMGIVLHALAELERVMNLR
jgi:DNA-binding SARP family transcriptional activator